MESIEGLKLINKMQHDLIKNGIVAETLIEGLTALRPYSVAEDDPTLSKTIRLTFEHLAAHGTFNIPIPGDEEVEQEIVAVEVKEADVAAEGAETEGAEAPVAAPVAEVAAPAAVTVDDGGDPKVESMDYLLSIMSDARNKMNRTELMEYRDALMEY
jgi:hypothetical protein